VFPKNKRTLILLFSVVCALWCVATPNAAMPQDMEPLPVEDSLRIHQFGQLMPVALSRDGQWLAYTVRNNEKVRSVDAETWARTGVRDVFTGTDIYILNIETGGTRTLTDGRDDNFMPVWSPDGRYLAFLSDRDGSGQLRLWVWDRMRNDMRKVSDLRVRQLGQIQWTADSQSILVPVVPEGISIEDYVRNFTSAPESQTVNGDSKTPGSTVTVYQSSAIAEGRKDTPKSNPWNLDIFRRDLASIHVASGTDSTVVRGRRIARYLISPDGSRVAYTIPKRFEKPGSQQTLFDLVTRVLSTSQEQVVASDVRFDYDGAAFSWSHDGRHIAYHTGGVEEKTADCFVAEADGRNRHNVSTLTPRQPSPYKSTIPLWDTRGEYIYFIRSGALWRSSIDQSKAVEFARFPDRRIVKMISQSENILWTLNGGNSTIVLAHDDAGEQDGFYKVDLTTGESTKLLEKGECYTCTNLEQPFRVTSDGREVVYFSEDVQHDADLWMSDASFKNPRPLTHLNPQFQKHKMGAARLVHWLSDDGEQLQGALLLPSGYKEGKRYPLIVWVYGGRTRSDHFDHFGFEGSGPFNMQLLASRGYAVFLPDTPQRLGTPMLDLAKTVMPGVNKVIEMGIADAARLGVMGHSNGGYSTLSLIVQSARFKAALEADGKGDLLGHYGEMDASGAALGISSEEQGQGLMGGTPWQFRDRYIENSPIFYLDRIETPLLIIHGSKDTVIAPFLADEVFVGLRRLGKEVEYAKYEGEGHSPVYWNYANQMDFCDRMIKWFDRYLKSLVH
jgi:dipeptidyl aminopeptidase/acylaminoacyl peptidase